jgi:hypothetical protein
MGTSGPRTTELALTLLLASGLIPAQAEEPLLKGLNDVRVVVTWTGGADADKSALQTGVELKLRQVGMHVFTPAELSGLQDAASYVPMLFIGVNGPGAAFPVTVQLYEGTYVVRDVYAKYKHTASDAYSQWYLARKNDPKPITDAESKEHFASAVAEMKENAALPLPLSRKATTWQMYGVVQSAQPESVKDIIARYAKASGGYMPPWYQHMMDLEVQAAMAEAKCNVNYSTVRDTINGFVDAFISEWLAANPKQR